MAGKRSVTLTFAGGARSVTGANFLIEAKDEGKITRILIDCGLAQGRRFCESTNREPFSYDPASIDAVFVTHAHADHIGLVPRLVKEGFRGKIYTTAPTAKLMPVMLEDSSGLIAREAKECEEEAPYTKEDVESVSQYMDVRPYRETIEVAEGIEATLYNAGHILGSATVLADVFGVRILFTGDLGRKPAIMVPDRDTPEGPVDYLVTESVYGNRVHEKVEASEAELLKSIKRVEKNKGTLIIPSFSLERTQIILATLDRFISAGTVRPLPVFLDSPLATKVTEVYRQFPEFLREEIRERLVKGDDPFSFPSLTVSYTPEESAEIDRLPAPKVIIAGAGMSHGGRVRRHERTYLGGSENALLLVGYQSAGSLGRRLKDGAREVLIDGKKVKVRAHISSTAGFSAHADRDDLLSFAESVKPKKAFVVLGEMESSAFLAQRLSGFLGIDTYIPQKGEAVDLSPE